MVCAWPRHRSLITVFRHRAVWGCALEAYSVLSAPGDNVLPPTANQVHDAPEEDRLRVPGTTTYRTALKNYYCSLRTTLTGGLLQRTTATRSKNHELGRRPSCG